MWITLLERATNPQNENIDIAAVEAFCALINKEKDGPLIGIKLLATRMHSKNEQEALQTLHILDYSMQKCGAIFQDEVGKFRFLNEMIKLVSPKYLGSHTPLSVKQKVLQLMYLWMLDYPKQSKIKDAYDMLKKQGVIKDVPLSVSADYTLERQQHNTIFQDEEKGKLLKKLLQSKNPEDLQAANRLIKTMVKEDEKKAELKSRRISELESVQNNIRLLNEMLDSFKTGVSSQDETELIKELHESCLRMRPNIVKLASETQQNDKILSEILRVNDELGQILDKFKMVIVIGQDVQGADKTSLLDLSNSVRTSLEILEGKSNVEMLCDILTAPISDGGQTGSDIASILKPIAVSTQLKLKDVNGDVEIQTNKQKAFEALDALGESFLLENLQSTTRLGNQFNKSSADKIPMNLLHAKSQSSLANLNLSQLSQLSQLTSMNHNAINMSTVNSDKDIDVTPTSRVELDMELTNLLLSASSSNENDLIESHANGAAIDDLLVDITTTPTPTPAMTPTLSRTISTSSTASISANGTVTSVVEKKDVEDKDQGAMNDVKTVMKLSELFVDVKSIKPGNTDPIVALDEEQGITLTLHFGRDKPHEVVSVLVVTIVSKNELPLKNVLFRAIIPKCCKLKLEPPSASDLPAYNPFLPPAAITQVMLIANPDRVQVSLKFIISYIVDDETMTEMGEIDALPI